MKKYTAKNKKKECATRGCRNTVKRGRVCYTCSSRKYRQKNPIRYAYHNMKAHAKERGKIFTISYEDFKKFCIKYEYIQGKGRTADSYTVDCIDPKKGYVKGNIQVLTLSDNVKKEHARRKKLIYDWRSKTFIVQQEVGIPDDGDNPF